MSIQRRIALVTGAGRGIGRASAIALSKACYEVVICARNAEELRIVQKEIESNGGKAYCGQIDVSSEMAVKEFCQDLASRYGTVDVLVNNAGISPMKNGRKIPIVDMSIDEWDAVLKINLTAPFLFARELVPNMINKKSGTIINIASAAARMGGIAAGSHYVASKAGLIGLTKVMAREFGEYGIRVNAICPGRIATPMLNEVDIDPTWADREVPLKRLGTPFDIAAAVSFLASDASSYMTGATIDINGGWVMY
ncbi:SDR family NAD(P)-dependent oxidoreductase [Agrobacterium sp. NPDC090283]|uniref:SDR family NAD(P)-dependent oxidoreductase n=1 Tax=Agrobacterium sp. NPDC090283 TaxID=3363920 RepID=UPI00383B56D7